MSIPIVSVIMPIYNNAPYLRHAVESILQQTFSDFELILVDDGSTDRSLDILRDYAAKDDRIHLISRDNRGIARSRNDGFQVTRGALIAVMDGDDVALPDRLARQVDFLQQHPEVVCVGGAHEIIDHKGRLLTCLSLPEQDEQIQQQALAGHGSICHPCAMIRRTALEQIGGYDETLTIAVDLDLWLRLGEVGKLANLSEPILQYRLHGNSISEQKGKLQRQTAYEICQRAWKRRGIEGKFEASYSWRPTSDRRSRHQFMLQYGWWAFNSAQRGTA
ncbi:MAG TPA: glycosyltransferase, partial [Allocoleopsis sp.]